jgi:hypothetical protein
LASAGEKEERETEGSCNGPRETVFERDFARSVQTWAKGVASFGEYNQRLRALTKKLPTERRSRGVVPRDAAHSILGL